MYTVGISLSMDMYDEVNEKFEMIITKLDIALSQDKLMLPNCDDYIDFDTKEEVLRYMTTMLSKYRLNTVHIRQNIHLKLRHLEII